MSLREADDDCAADYVMGLLQGAELAAAEQRMAEDMDFAAAVSHWRDRLAEFDATAEALAPSAPLWDRIAESTRMKPAIPLPGARAALRGATLWDNIRFWRGAGIGGVFAALMLVAILIGALATSHQLRRELIALAQRKPVYIAVLVDNAGNDTGAIVNTFSDGRVELIPLRAIEVPAGRALQVWTSWDAAVGPKPIALTSQSRTLQLDLEALPDTVPDQLFEITLEPETGSPTDRPTGPVLFRGKAARAL